MVSLLGGRLAAVAAGIMLLSCGVSSVKTADLPAASLLRAAIASFGEAQSFHVAGSVQLGLSSYTFDAGVARPETLAGTVTLKDAKPAKFIVASGATFAQGDSVGILLGSVQQRVAGERPVLIHNPDWLAAIVEITDPARFQTNFGGDLKNLKAVTTQFGGQAAELVSNASESIYIAASAPKEIIRVERKGDPAGGSSLGKVEISLTGYGQPVSAQPPADYLDFNKRNTLPANYVLNSSPKLGSCKHESCSVSVTVLNQNSGTAVTPEPYVRFPFVVGETQVEFDHCDAPIPLVGYQGTTTVSCAVSDAAWQDNQDTFQVHAVVFNPFWT